MVLGSLYLLKLFWIKKNEVNSFGFKTFILKTQLMSYIAKQNPNSRWHMKISVVNRGRIGRTEVSLKSQNYKSEHL